MCSDKMSIYLRHQRLLVNIINLTLSRWLNTISGTIEEIGFESKRQFGAPLITVCAEYNTFIYLHSRHYPLSSSEKYFVKSLPRFLSLKYLEIKLEKDVFVFKEERTIEFGQLILFRFSLFSLQFPSHYEVSS